MSFPLLFGFSALIVAMLLKPLEAYLRVPFPVILVVAGFILSEIYVALGLDTGVRYHNFYTLSYYLFIPIILFAAAFHISPRLLIKECMANLLFALPITLITILITAVALYYGMNHPSGFPWVAAFITASLLASTGAHAIIDYLYQLKISQRLINILQIESLFTGIIAVIFFNYFTTMALHTHAQDGVWLWLMDFIMLLVGGILIGVILGYIALFLLRLVKEPLAHGLITIAAVYFAYILAQSVWGVSGGVAVFTMGLMLGSFGKKYFQSSHHFVEKVWDLFYLFALSGLFLLVGVSITWQMFGERWLAMIIGIIAILVARAISVYGGLSLLNLSHRSYPFNKEEQTLLVWGGARGALPIALAFAVPHELDYWWTIQSIAFGVVLFTLLVQAPSIRLLLKWMKK